MVLPRSCGAGPLFHFSRLTWGIYGATAEIDPFRIGRSGPATNDDDDAGPFFRIHDFFTARFGPLYIRQHLHVGRPTVHVSEKYKDSRSRPEKIQINRLSEMNRLDEEEVRLAVKRRKLRTVK